MAMDKESVLKLLWAADVTYDDPDTLYPDDDPKNLQTLNMNDVFGWALAWEEYIPDHDLATVGNLYFMYGLAGLYFWVSQRNDEMRSRFEHINRAIDFVLYEESLRIGLKRDYCKIAFFPHSYTLGEQSGNS